MNNEMKPKAKITTRVKKYNDGDTNKEPVIKEKTFEIEGKKMLDFLKGSG
jgi:hypothetical protein